MGLGANAFLTRCDNQKKPRHGGIRTRDAQFRKLSLYPAELRAHKHNEHDRIIRPNADAIASAIFFLHSDNGVDKQFYTLYNKNVKKQRNRWYEFDSYTPIETRRLSCATD